MTRHKRKISKKYERAEQVQVCCVNKLAGAIRATLGLYTPAIVRRDGKVIVI